MCWQLFGSFWFTQAGFRWLLAMTPAPPSVQVEQQGALEKERLQAQLQDLAAGKAQVEQQLQSLRQVIL